MKIFELTTDVGKFNFSIITFILKKKLSSSELKEIINKIQLNECYIIIFDAYKLVSLYQILYPIYLAFRNRIQGLSIAKDLIIEILTLSSCTRQISEGMSEISPIDKKIITVTLVCKDIEKLSISLNNLLKEINYLDYFIGTGCLRGIELPSKCRDISEIDEIFTKIINTILEKY